ncbi:P-loop NTPase family protein, partial [Staphylococcus epidermidis]
MVELSRGQQKTLLFPKTLIHQPHLLFLHQPTNHLHFQSIRSLINYLNQYPHTLLFLTHHPYFLNQLSTPIIQLHT